MDLTLAVVVASLSSPVILYLIQWITSRKSSSLSGKIDELTEALRTHMIDKATFSLRHKNWEILEKRSASRRDYRVWYNFLDALKEVLKESEWDDELRNETKVVKEIMDKGD